jgi:hypothetical protein
VLSTFVIGPGATPAEADSVLDANCPGPHDGPFTGVLTDWREAQTFTAQTTGSLVRGELELQIKFGAPGDFVMQVVAADASGVPTNTVLASTTIPDASVPDASSRFAGTFAAPASVVAGGQYALLITRPGGGNFGLWTRDGNICPGQPFRSDPLGGAWFLESPYYDLVFAVFVEPVLEPPPKAERTLTLDANKDKVKQGKKVRLAGHLDSAEQACESDQAVEVQRKRSKQTGFTTFAELQTDAQGDFSLKRRMRKTFEFRAQVPETATCEDGFSNTEKVKVKKKTKKR